MRPEESVELPDLLDGRKSGMEARSNGRKSDTL
jgi:hypothetical protein